MAINPPVLSSFHSIAAIAAVVKKSGITVVFSVVLGFALNRVYDDLTKRNELLVELVREQVRESKAVSDALVAVGVQLNRDAAILERLERSIVKGD